MFIFYQYAAFDSVIEAQLSLFLCFSAAVQSGRVDGVDPGGDQSPDRCGAVSASCSSAGNGCGALPCV